MSGGSLDYVFSRIEVAAEDIERQMREWDKESKDGLPYFGNNEYYRKTYPDKTWLFDEKQLRKKVFGYLEDSIKALRKASIMAREVEWLFSGDTGFESFCLDVEEELEKLEHKKEQKVEVEYVG